MIDRITILHPRQATQKERHVLRDFFIALFGGIADCSHHHVDCRCEMCSDLGFGPRDICPDCGRQALRCRCGGGE